MVLLILFLFLIHNLYDFFNQLLGYNIHPNAFCKLNFRKFNLKIYLDTDAYLKQQWKIQRDVTKRGADPDSLLATMKQREPDYLTYIKPQEDAADIIIHLSAKGGDINTIFADINIKQLFVPAVHNKLLPFLRENPSECDNDTVLYKFQETVPHEAFDVHLKASKCNLKISNNNYEGIIQYLIISLLWK